MKRDPSDGRSNETGKKNPSISAGEKMSADDVAAAAAAA